MASSTCESDFRYLEAFPEGCIAKILSFTTPPDVCRLSCVSRNFQSAAGSDDVWEHFLPSDHQAIIARSAELPFFAGSRKELFFTLCARPLLIDHGRMSFQLDKWTGNKCFMASARQLRIVWGDAPRYWDWTPYPNTRFSEVAILLDVCWLEICYNLSELLPMLSSATRYAAYFVFKFNDDKDGFDEYPAKVSVQTLGGHDPDRDIRLVWLDPPVDLAEVEDETFAQLPTSYDRGDGWLEVEMGVCSNLGAHEHQDAVEARLFLTRGGYANWKRGLIVQGIEVRPQQRGNQY